MLVTDSGSWSEARGEEIPSWAAEVGTLTNGMCRPRRGDLGDVDLAAAADGRPGSAARAIGASASIRSTSCGCCLVGDDGRRCRTRTRSGLSAAGSRRCPASSGPVTTAPLRRRSRSFGRSAPARPGPRGRRGPSSGRPSSGPCRTELSRHGRGRRVACLDLPARDRRATRPAAYKGWPRGLTTALLPPGMSPQRTLCSWSMRRTSSRSFSTQSARCPASVPQTGWKTTWAAVGAFGATRSRVEVVASVRDDELHDVRAGEASGGSPNGCAIPCSEPGHFTSTLRITRGIRGYGRDVERTPRLHDRGDPSVGEPL